MPTNAPEQAYTEIFNALGQPIGAILGPEAWSLVRKTIVDRFNPTASPEMPREPLEDWQQLKEHWDFKYPVDVDVACSICGSSTDNWEADEPRRFRLTAANFGGLVTFRCMTCQAKIMKRHFKDRVTVEAVPFQEIKNPMKEGRR